MGKHQNGKQKTALTLIGLTGTLIFACNGFAQEKDPDLRAGDIAQIMLPATALGLTYYFDDPEGRKQWAKETASTLTTTEILKSAFNQRPMGIRPNGKPGSFPSGHTASACSGALFLGERYGWSYGAPALFFAGVTAYSRVDEGLHRRRDVVAGCALAYAFNQWFVSERETPVLLTAAPQYRGITLTFSYRY